jgi:gallate dioxygenase
MARIIGAVASSHSPTIGFALDAGKQDDPAWLPIFQAYEPVRCWLRLNKPDVLFFIFNDHGTSFFFDHYSHFALGIGESYAPADEGGGARALPVVRGHAGLAQHVAFSLAADSFDLSFFQDKSLDHGLFSPLSMMWPHQPEWPGAIVPLAVGVLQFPIPSALRCYQLGRALRNALESYPEELNVAIAGTGGLSHQVHGERAGFNNTEWDLQFLDLIEKNPTKLTEMTIGDFARLGGVEGAEVIMWLIMRGALSDKVRKVHQSYYLPSMTGLATAIYEDLGPSMSAQQASEHRKSMYRQFEEFSNLKGSYPFTLAASVKSYRLNRFLHGLTIPEKRRQFLEDQGSLFAEAGLTAEESEMVRDLDWRRMIHYGVSFFMLEKLGAVVGVSNLHIYAAMRGEPLEVFLKTRNAPGALYSVSGTTDQSWNTRNDDPE